MSIYGQLQQYAVDAIVELYELDLTKFGDTVYRFHNGKSELNQNIVWQGNTYTAFPCKLSGMQVSGKNQVRPQLTLANTNGVLSAVLMKIGDITGAKFRRQRTKVIYLDSVNFENGNLMADPNAHFPDDVFYLSQMKMEDYLKVVFEMLPATDLESVALPRRQIIANHCQFRYKGEHCGYTGLLPTCNKTLKDCKRHFGERGLLPFGGFPGAAYIRF